MNEFKIFVERIVRPIQAAESRKNKMREELMTHLLDAHAEGFASGESDPFSFATTRLGDAVALQTELQATVPCWERWGSRKVRSKTLANLELAGDLDRGDSFKVAIQSTVAIMTVLPFIVAPVVLVSCAIKWNQLGSLDWSHALAKTGVAVCALGAFGLSYGACIYLFRKLGLHRVVHASSDAPSFVKAGIGMVSYTVCILLFFLELIALDRWVAITGAQTTMPELVTIVATEPRIYLCLVLGLSVTTFGLSAERRQFLKWGSLEIDELRVAHRPDS